MDLQAHTLFGGPKIDQEPLNVLSVTPDKELKKVFIKIAGMKEKQVIYLRLATLFQSHKGKELFTSDASTRSIGGQVPAKPESKLYFL
ncbi:hypothetical protein PQO01_20065 [Lentisphaera marina]|uniref:hypothetical protein n=1 Tax=Lentisphaera marina TaxID=1111041 RepID=UPI0023665D68|nr:hypothetical protein [Lentisphaera marina]MDD7987255.1 hypothetical protein [Lentisphaera marina]